MTYSQLRAFHNVARYGGFSKAAEQMHQSQPVLSGHIKELEKIYDTLLFKREKRSVKLTLAGEELFILTKQFFETEDQILNHMEKSKASITGKIRIVADSAIHILKTLKWFRKHYPAVTVDLRIGNSQEVIDILRNFDAEVGVTGSPIDGSDLQTFTLGTSSIKVIASSNFFKKVPRQITFDKLTKLPLIFREKGSHTRKILVSQASKQNFKLAPVIEVTGREALHELVANGLGIGFVSQAEIAQDPRLVNIDIDCGNTEMTETLVYLSARKDLPIVRAFLKAAQNS